MQGRFVTACAVIAALLLVGPALSETRTIRVSGEWELFGGTSSTGSGVCGMSTEPSARYFGLKVFSRQVQDIVIHVGTRDFPVAKDQRTNMRMQVDTRPAWNSTGKGFTFDDGDPGVEWVFTGDAGANFVAELFAGSALRISWPNAGISDWTFSLAGTGALSAEYDQCLRSLK